MSVWDQHKREAKAKEIYSNVQKRKMSIEEQLSAYEKYLKPCTTLDEKTEVADIYGRFSEPGTRIRLDDLRKKYLERLENDLIVELLQIQDAHQLADNLERLSVCANELPFSERTRDAFFEAADRAVTSLNEKSREEIERVKKIADVYKEGGNARTVYSQISSILSDGYAAWLVEKEKLEASAQAKIVEESRKAEAEKTQQAIAENFKRANEQRIHEKILETLAKPQINDIQPIESLRDEIERSKQDLANVNWVIERLQFKVTTSLMTNLVADMRGISASLKALERMPAQQELFNQGLLNALQLLAEQQVQVNLMVKNLGECLQQTMEQQNAILKQIQVKGETEQALTTFSRDESVEPSIPVIASVRRRGRKA